MWPSWPAALPKEGETLESTLERNAPIATWTDMLMWAVPGMPAVGGLCHGVRDATTGRRNALEEGVKEAWEAGRAC